MASPTSPSAAADPPSPPSPTASFYDLSDASETDYSTIHHTTSNKGVKLLFAKSKVYIHPTPSARDNVGGWVGLMQRKSSANSTTASAAATESATAVDDAKRKEKESLLLSWQPDAAINSTREIYTKVEDAASSDSSSKRTHLVPPPPVTTSVPSSASTAFAIPITEIYSLTIRPPSTGWYFGSLIINTRHGDSFPALFFHDSECDSTLSQRKRLQKETFSIEGPSGGVFWGGDEVLRWLRLYVSVERSTVDTGVYLVEAENGDRASFLSGNAGSPPSPHQVKALLEGKPVDSKPSPSSRTRTGSTSGADAVTKALTSARWSLLEKMAQVTTFTRRTASQISESKSLPPQVRRLMQDPQVQTISDEFDSARLYLARWAMGIAEQAERERGAGIWSARDVAAVEGSEVGEFEVLDAGSLSLEDRRRPVTKAEWEGWFNIRTGRLEKTVDEVKDRVFHGGLDADDGVRKEAWLFLLGVYDWDSSKEERAAKMNSLRDEYIRLKAAWWERMVDETGTLEEREWWKEQRMRIEKDVHRTDRHIPLFLGEDIPHPDPTSPFAETGTNVHLEQMKDMLLTYNELNRDLGYVQGMSDLLAPIYAVQQDDAVAFWGFVGFMERMERNFLRDQSGMRLQLTTLDQLCRILDPELYAHLLKLDSTNFFFFFRMLLVWFKREFSFPDILALWERLWTDFLTANFHLFIAMAILEKHREVILNHLRGFDEVLKYVNELSGTIDLPSTLVRAEALFRRFQRVVEAVDKKANFPSAPKVRQRLPYPPPPSTISEASANGAGAEATKPGADGRPRRPSSQASAPAGATAGGRRQGGGLSAIIAGSSGLGADGQARARAQAQAQAQAKSNQARGKGSGSDSAVAADQDEDDGPGIITEELRALLSRKVVKLDKKEVVAHGGGVGS